MIQVTIQKCRTFIEVQDQNNRITFVLGLEMARNKIKESEEVTVFNDGNNFRRTYGRPQSLTKVVYTMQVSQ